jgi:lysophospholipase L1-like esterase
MYRRTILFIGLPALILMMAFSVKTRITVYTIGDSTMANKDTVGNPERGWAMALPLFFDSAEVKIENHAMNGRSTKSFMDEERWNAILKTLKKGDYVFIQFGHNDEKQEQPSLYAAPYGDYTDNLTRFVKETRAKGAFPVLMTSIVRRHFDENGALKNSHGDYPDAVRKLAKKLNVPMIDMEAKSRRLIQDMGHEDSKKLFMHLKAGVYEKFPKGKEDDTHLVWDGAKAIASLAVEGIKELKLPLAQSLQPALFEKHRTTYIYIDPNEKPVVHTAVSLLQKDVQAVFNANLQLTANREEAQIIVSSSKELQGKWEAFQLDIRDKKLFITGSDARGKAYGILEISRLIGVSPWEWWADVKPGKRDVYLLSEIEKTSQSPSVQYRGIFLNDEDWGLLPWATEKFRYELIDGVKLSDNTRWKGAIGSETYEKIFELLLRLRANTIWSAMHECTVPFYFVKGNREIAGKYGIVVGTSHCEPLMRNSASEWDVSGKGDYNFVTNSRNVLDYWAERLNELQGSENIFTIGMRGKHDGMMQGVKTLEEHKKALTQIIPAQQELLGKHINPKPEEIPQVFIPYKEVLDVYDDGLEVPEYVTLVWCDDNYGYIRRLFAEKEQRRKGSADVYYHVSYWGRPHDYLWLASTSPALIHTEMKRAYEHNAKKLWILNVGDIKPAEYLTEFFLDMAWNMESMKDGACFSHLNGWAEREFGKQHAGAITAVMKEYHRLANIRKPEFTGWNRVEESGYPHGELTPVRDSEYNPVFNNELQHRIDDYLLLEQQTAKIKQNIPAGKTDAFFQLVEYPVRGASLMNQKWLYRQLSNYFSGLEDTVMAKRYAAESLNAYHAIERITEEYNTQENGKWSGIMDFHPRDLPVFAKPEFPQPDSPATGNSTGAGQQRTQKEPAYVAARNASQADNILSAGTVVEGLGHSFSAVKMQKGQTLDFTFEIPEAGDYFLKTGIIPNHDVDGEGMIIEILLNDKTVSKQDYSVEGRSEAWKQNVLRGQAINSMKLNYEQPGEIKISIKALTNHIILDQIMLLRGEMDFYEFPVKTN